jgi:RNA-splicing ligase RtcB
MSSETLEIKGIHNTTICYTGELEDAAADQIRDVCDRAEFVDSKIRIMPDVHAGKGCTIGTTMTITDKIVPGMVGVDIGCGMETVELAERDPDFAALDAVIRREIPDVIVGAIAPTAEIVERIRPVYNFKAGE